MDILVTLYYVIDLKISVCPHKVLFEGSISPIFLGPRLYFFNAKFYIS